MVYFRVVPPKLCEITTINKEGLWITNFSNRVFKIMIFCSSVKRDPKQRKSKIKLTKRYIFFTTAACLIVLWSSVVFHTTWGMPLSTHNLFILNPAIIKKYIFLVGDDGLNSRHGVDLWSAAETAIKSLHQN
jgi:hypothetical protein